MLLPEKKQEVRYNYYASWQAIVKNNEFYHVLTSHQITRGEAEYYFKLSFIPGIKVKQKMHRSYLNDALVNLYVYETMNINLLID